MKIRKSIIYPILGVLTLLISLATYFHYISQLSLLRETTHSKELLRSHDLHFAIQTIIEKEVDKLTALAKALKEQDELVWEIAYYPNAEGNVSYMKEVMDRVYLGLNVDIFIALDTEGNVIYQAHNPEERGGYADYWGTVEVLDGQDIVVSDNSSGQWKILSMVPAERDDRIYGAIIIGTLLNSSFANDIAEATGVGVSFGSMDGLFASSLSELNKENHISLDDVISSLTRSREILKEIPEGSSAVYYAPVKIVDDHFSLVVEMDTSETQMLLSKYQRKITFTSLGLLLFTLLCGSLLTLYHVRPLKKLIRKAEDVVRGLSGEKIDVSTEDEIQQLVISFETLVETVGRYSQERSMAESALLDEKERLAVTLRSIGDAVISTDNSGRIILINKVAEKLTGWEDGSAIGKPLVQVFNTLDEKTRRPSEDFVAKVLEAQSIIDRTIPTILISRNGTERMISEVGAPIRDKEDKVLGVVLVFSDITERLRVEEELLKVKKLESVGVLAGGIAHDFNNLLMAIMGNISLAMKFVKNDSKVYERLNEADKATVRAKDLTQKLLTFSKGGAPVKKTASIEELIRESAGFILSGSRTKTVFSFSGDLWAADLDTGQMSQVIQNLCLNASQAMPDGGTLWITAENETLSEETNLPLEPGKYIKVTLEDNGVGISRRNIDRIFDPYFTTKQTGSGLGLATVYSIIKNHHGYITVESETDMGTKFTFYLPASEKMLVEEMQEQPGEYQGTGRILVMDDEDIVREVAGEMLSHIGFEVEFALHGEEALQKYSAALRNGKPFDAVIMDLTVPGGMGGGEAITKLLDIDQEATAIVSSGYSNNPIMANYKEYGFRGMLNKPFRLSEVEKVLGSILVRAPK